MNKNFLVNYKAILWKELIEGVRMSKFSFPFTVMMVVLLQYIPIANIMRNESIPVELKDAMLSNLSFYVPLMIIPFFGNTIVFRAIYEEKINKTIQILMASGICPSVIWLGKFSIAAIVAYTSSLFAVIGYSLFVKFYTGRTMTMDFNIWICVLLVIPMIAIGVLSLVSFAYLWLRNARVLGMVFPMISILGVWNISMKYSMEKPAALTSAVAIGAGIVAIGLSFIGAKTISKERIADI